MGRMAPLLGGGASPTVATYVGNGQRASSGTFSPPVGSYPGDYLIIQQLSATPPSGGSGLAWVDVSPPSGMGGYLFARVLQGGDFTTALSLASLGQWVAYNGPKSMAYKVSGGSQGPPGINTNFPGFVKASNFMGRLGITQSSPSYGSAGISGFVYRNQITLGGSSNLEIIRDNLGAYTDNALHTTSWDQNDPASGYAAWIYELRSS